MNLMTGKRAITVFNQSTTDTGSYTLKAAGDELELNSSSGEIGRWTLEIDDELEMVGNFGEERQVIKATKN